MRALAGVFEWPGFRPMEKPITQVNSAIYAQYEGEYRYVDEPEYGVQVIKTNEHLYIKDLPDGLWYQLYPETETDFFCQEHPEEITFIKDSKGEVETMMIGKYSHLARVD